jgi:pimeloyl-[acyl-carrier protein] synthase
VNSADAPVVRLTLASPEAVQNPVPVFHRVLEAGPVIYDPDLGGYVVGHYDDVRTILKLDADFAQHAEFHEKMIGARDFLGMADPEHAEVRSAFSPSFTTSAVRTLESATRAIVDDAVTMSLKSRDFDGVATIGRPVAGGTLAALLHVPSRDVPTFMGWAEDIGKTTEALAEPDPGERARLEQVGIEATKLLLDYAGVLLRDQGAGEHHPDLIADFANSAVARQMPAIERQANVARIILGGHDNTWKLIAHLLVEFGRRHDQWRAVVADRSLIPAAVEETLRYVTPAPVIQRVATQDVTVGGYRISAGSPLFLMLGAANRDPSRWPEPDEFDIFRPHRPHLDFGLGPHVCIGGSTTRMELRVVLEALADRMPDYHLLNDDIQYGPIFMSRGPREVWIAA